MPSAGLQRQIKELVAAQLLLEELPGQFAFRHALTQEAVYATLLLNERRRFHNLVAETLERQYGGAPDFQAEIAFHYFRAERWEKAMNFSRLAGERAQSRYAPGEAAMHFTHALEAAARLGEPVPARLNRARGQVYETLGDFEAARRDYETALQVARQAGDLAGEWQITIDLGFLWASKDYQRTENYFRQALKRAHDLEDPAVLGHSLNRMGNWHLNISQPLEALAYHREALAIFEDLNDRRGLAETLDLMGLAAYLSGDVQRGTLHYQRAIALFRELNDRRGLSSSLTGISERGPFYLSDAVFPASASLADCIRDCREALDIAREIGWRAGEAYAVILIGMYQGSQGDYGPALEHLHSARDIAVEIGHRQWTALADFALGLLYLDILVLTKAQEHLERALSLAAEINSLLFIHQISAGLAYLYSLKDEIPRAETLVETNFGPETRAGSFGQRLGDMARLHIALRKGEALQALEIADQLFSVISGDLRPPRTAEKRGRWAVPRLSLLRGEALAALRRFPEAEAELKRALQDARRFGARPLQWRSHLELGKMVRAQGLNGQASREFERARQLVAELAAVLPEPGLRKIFQETASGLFPSEREVAPVEQEKTDLEAGGERPVEPLRLMCVFAHPDDESLGIGATLAKYAAEGVETYLVTATRGERGWVGDPQEHPGLEALGKIREGELRAAAAILGLREVQFLGYTDGELDSADPGQAIAQIVLHLRRVRPQVVVTFAPDGTTGHPDHIAVSQFTQAAIVCAADPDYLPPPEIAIPARSHRVSKLYYMVDSKELIHYYQTNVGDMGIVVDGKDRKPVPWEDWAITTRIEAEAYWEQMWGAITQHRSQSHEFTALEQVDREQIKKLWTCQSFYRVFSTVNGGSAVESDLFEGIRY